MKASKFYIPLLVVLWFAVLSACVTTPGSLDFFYGEIGITPVGSSGHLVNVPDGKVPIVTDIFLMNGNPDPVDPSVFSAITITVQRADGVIEQPIAGIRAVGNELTHIHFKKGVRLSDEAQTISAAYTIGTAGVISVRIAGYFEDTGG